MQDLQRHLEYLQDRVKHEDSLLNHRLGWLWTLQRLLLTAFALLMKEIAWFGKVPAIVICVGGLLSSLSVGYSALIGHRVLDRLHPEVKSTTIAVEDKLGVPHLDQSSVGGWGFLHPWRFLPWVFIVVWLILLVWVNALEPKTPTADFSKTDAAIDARLESDISVRRTLSAGPKLVVNSPSGKHGRYGQK